MVAKGSGADRYLRQTGVVGTGYIVHSRHNKPEKLDCCHYAFTVKQQPVVEKYWINGHRTPDAITLHLLWPLVYGLLQRALPK